ncbi:U32 family peptidase [Aquabacterium lacunae]|uniref:U32 family peptidase n=1 Tax=Aquabacterium lacunae TaxID=2528630 RepID=A0A4Q9H279_9BURK|nr:U32 family peptidase [Aquabacterium lacunae]TBO28848.1 U32 family peptidase [Aquabacterium lacunae]
MSNASNAPHSRHHIELLSPARTADIGIEAVNHGADAVYIGGPSFGARSNASNEVADIARLVTHAHRFNARIFTTINTILRDDELEPARQLIWQLYDAGVDALIVQDMGILELDLPPIQLHASTQTDIRTPEKARFLQDAGFSQIVLARELTLQQIQAVAQHTTCALEFFIHGALCVAYSGQCFISHAHTGRSANRGDCSQACRLPYNVLDSKGQVVAYEQHVLSMKDNDQSANLRALIDAGISSFKIEGRYKDMGYVKNITAHYRQLLDGILEERPELARTSSGHSTFYFQPEPERNFNRGTTDYFVNGRKEDIGAFDSPKHLGLPVGEVAKVGDTWFDVAIDLNQTDAIHNGDGLNYQTLTRDLVGVQVNTAEAVGASGRIWRVHPNEDMAALPDLKPGVAINRNRDQAWDRTLSKKSAERRIGVWMTLDDTDEGLSLTVTDEDGHEGVALVEVAKQPPQQADRAEATLREHLGKLGGTIFHAHEIALNTAQPWFVPASVLNALRREALAAVEQARAEHWERLVPATPVEPPVPYPEDSLSYLANVYNHKARDFYARHGVKVIEAAYESHEELGEVSLMITKHCVRFSLSLCPKQAKGVQGVQGQVKAEPLQLINGKEKLTLRFDCKPCEMHVVGKMKTSVLNQVAAAPIQFYKTRPAATR